MSQKRRKADSGKAIGETTALRWEPTHVTKPNPRVVSLHGTRIVVHLYRALATEIIRKTIIKEIIQRHAGSEL